MVEGGPIDVLTGDWLAELTMLILARQRLKHGAGSGYARTFLTQMEQVLGTCLERGIKVVSNAGGLDPGGLRRRRCASSPTELGLAAEDRLRRRRRPAPAHRRAADGRRDLRQPRHRRAVRLGRDAGPDRQRLPRRLRDHGRARRRGRRRHHRAGHRCRARRAVRPPGGTAGHATTRRARPARVVAGHVIECGAQATGGNYAFFTEVPGLEHAGFPWAEVAHDGRQRHRQARRHRRPSSASAP